MQVAVPTVALSTPARVQATPNPMTWRSLIPGTASLQVNPRSATSDLIGIGVDTMQAAGDDQALHRIGQTLHGLLDDRCLMTSNCT